MSLPAVAPTCCESCGQPVPPKRPPAVQLAEPFNPRPRKGGPQASAGVLVRVLTAYFEDEGLYPVGHAERVARRLVRQALPRRQRKPRTR